LDFIGATVLVFTGPTTFVASFIDSTGLKAFPAFFMDLQPLIWRSYIGDDS